MDCNRKSGTLPFTISSTLSRTAAWECLPNNQIPSKFVCTTMSLCISLCIFTICKSYADQQGLLGAALFALDQRFVDQVVGDFETPGDPQLGNTSRLQGESVSTQSRNAHLDLQLATLLQDFEELRDPTIQDIDTTPIRATALPKSERWGYKVQVMKRRNQNVNTVDTSKHSSKR